MRGLRALSASILVLAAAASLAGPAAAGTAPTPPPLQAARELMGATRDRLELMDEVMAAKWFSRTPIQDPAQEATVIETAQAQAGTRGVASAGVGDLFEAEIVAAKEVELGWGSEWLFLGAPPGLAAPELATLRSELGAVSERIVAFLPRLEGLTSVPDVERRLRQAAARILRVPHLGAKGRLGVVEALLLIRLAA